MQFKIEPHKTYASPTNAERAVINTLGEELSNKLFWFVYPVVVHGQVTRYTPVFVGQKAIEYGIHFKFNVVHSG